ncbi:MAG: Asp-tRNA(Asn)/Glu-tRNA(Gln) amidotransferase subunit GatC [Nitrospirales bacterium]|nr:Asp-tRNA(Asn)/Glu-tRNA(Gln) amidotransferase subunit GatC [Nitrospirales bacterium]
MGHISKSEVEKVADLARLDLTEAEKSLFGGQLSQILDYVDQLQTVSTEGVSLTSSVAEIQSEWREDVVVPGLTVEQALANAPESNQGLFVVPKILGK